MPANVQEQTLLPNSILDKYPSTIVLLNHQRKTDAQSIWELTGRKGRNPPRLLRPCALCVLPSASFTSPTSPDSRLGNR